MSATNKAETRTDQTMEQPAADPACAKCGSWQYRTEIIRATGTGLS